MPDHSAGTLETTIYQIAIERQDQLPGATNYSPGGHVVIRAMRRGRFLHADISHAHRHASTHARTLARSLAHGQKRVCKREAGYINARTHRTWGVITSLLLHRCALAMHNESSNRDRHKGVPHACTAPHSSLQGCSKNSAAALFLS